MAGPTDFTDQRIQETYQRVLQISSSGQLTDGTGSVVSLDSTAVVSASHALTASYAISASHEITLEISSSHAETADSVPYSGLTGTVPTWNQDTTGNAATATTASNATTIGPIASDLANRFLTSDGDGTLTAESNLAIDDSGNIVFAGGELIGSGSRTGLQSRGFISGSTIIAENHITASGNISSSGIIYAEHLYSSDDAEITDDLSLGGNLNLADNSKIVSTNTSTTYIKLNNDDYWIINANNVDTARFTSAGTVFNEGAAASQDFRVESLNDPYAFNIDSGLNAIELGRAATTHVTASGNISSSGGIYANDYYSKDQAVLNYSVTNNRIAVGNKPTLIQGNLTASNDISASGLISAGNFHVPGQGRISFDNTDTDDQFIKGLDNSIIIDADDRLQLRADHTIEFQNESDDATVTIDAIGGHISASGNITASGNISSSGYIYAGGDIHAVGDVVASSTTPSDYRLKENIRPIERPLEKILNLDGKEFDWKKSGDPDFGLIAQDVEKIIPKLVKEKNILGAEETQKVVNYISIIPLLIESIKELNDKIEEIKNG